MILASCALLLSAFPSPAPPGPPPSAQEEDPLATYEAMRSEAGTDVEKLWGVYEYCQAHHLDTQGRSVLRAILDVDDGADRAHDLLGHIRFEGRWYKSQAELAEHMRAQGMVRWKDQWVPAAEAYQLASGYAKHEGRWVPASALDKIEKGYVQVDMDWLPAEEVEQAAQAGTPLYKCGDEWLDESKANLYHTRLYDWWRIPSEHFLAFSTCTRELTGYALDHMEWAYKDLARLFGREPEALLTVIVLNNQNQYNDFAGTTAQTGIPPEWSGYSAFHYAFQCESWYDTKTSTYPGAACSYWDEHASNGNTWGPLSVRHAAGHAYANAIDPSLESVKAVVANPTSGQFNAAGFWGEKKLPMWLHFGAASYVERFLIDPWAEGRGGSPTWLRDWSLQELAKQGGLGDLKAVMAFTPAADAAANARFLLQSGLLVAFVLDGGEPAVMEKHAALKVALREGKGIRQAVSDLEAEIAAHEAELREFAGL